MGPRRALRDLHCGWEHPFHELLGPHRSASSERSGRGRTTGKGAGAQWRKVEQGTTYYALSLGTVSEPPNLAVTERPRLWGKGFEDFSEPLPLCIKLSPTRFSQAAWCLQWGPQEVHEIYPAWWFHLLGPHNPHSGRLAQPHCLRFCSPAGPWPPAGMGKGRVLELHPRNLVGCMDLKNLVAAQAEKKGGGHLAALSWWNPWLSCWEGPFHGDPVQWVCCLGTE